MLRSKYCQLEDQTEHDLTTLGECPLDQARTCSPSRPYSSLGFLHQPLCIPRALHCRQYRIWQC